jgi:hypothetical protein
MLARRTPGIPVRVNSMRRALVGFALVGGLTLAGCSASADSLPTTTHCPSGTAACGAYRPTLSTTTSTVPPTSTTTTLPAPLALGTPTELSWGSTGGEVAVNRVWMDAIPQHETADSALTGVTTLSGAVRYLLASAHLPLDTKLTWVGVDLAITITEGEGIVLGSATGQGQTVLFFVVNGPGSASGTDDSILLESGFEVGVQGCPFPFPPLGQGSLRRNQSVSGCVALAVPVGTKISTVGFELAPVGAPVHVAQWSA